MATLRSGKSIPHLAESPEEGIPFLEKKEDSKGLYIIPFLLP
jgi:hypothetical protein